jgi:hypothetical protein
MRGRLLGYSEQRIPRLFRFGGPLSYPKLVHGAKLTSS